MRDNAVVGVLKREEKLEVQKQIRHLEGQRNTKSGIWGLPSELEDGGATADN
jgi:hypothetical protein